MAEIPPSEGRKLSDEDERTGQVTMRSRTSRIIVGIGLVGVLILGAAAYGTVQPAGAAAATAATGGTPYSWGQNYFGSLGVGHLTGPQQCHNTAPCSESAVPIPHLVGITAIAMGSQGNGLALLKNGTVETWGDNSYDELGTGHPSGACQCSASPVLVHGLSEVVAVAGGGTFDLALLSNGTVKAWGGNDEGQLGVGTHTGPSPCYGVVSVCSSLPVTVHGLSGVIVVSAGRATGMALLKGGTVKAWGDDGRGELGVLRGPQTCQAGGSIACSSTPVAIAGLSSVKAISASDAPLALLTNGTVKAWGDNTEGGLGIGTDSTGPSFCQQGGACSPKPVMVKGLSDVKSISAGGTDSMALLTEGTVKIWGNGYMGNGSEYSQDDSPTLVKGLGGVRSIAAGSGYDNFVLLNKGTLMAWGNNPEGELGDNTSTGPQSCSPDGYLACSTTPTEVYGLWGVTAISAGGAATILALADSDATIKVANITHPSTGTGDERMVVTGTGFSPHGKFWVGVNPQEDQLTYCGGPGQGGWCALRPTASATGTFSVTITLTDVPSGCPPDIRIDATDLTTNIGSNEVLSRPGGCVSTISVGNGPLAVSSDGTHVWVSNNPDNTVTELDASNGSVINTISVGTRPNAISSDGTHVWVLSASDGTVAELDASNGSLVQTISVGNQPFGICSDGTHVWVSNYADNTVTELDASDGSLVNTISVGTGPRGISSDGSHVWVVNAGTAR